MTGTGKTVKTMSHTGNSLVDGLFSGYAWKGAITYAFPASKKAYGGSGYSSSDEHLNGFGAVSAKQQAAVKFALDTSHGGAANNGFSIEGFTNAKISAGSASKSTLRFAMSQDPDTAWGYYPSQGKAGGDVWFGYKHNSGAPVAGNYEWATVLHEIGHAMGLKHGHEYDGGFWPLPAKYDSMEYSIMTYRAYIRGPTDGYTNENYGYAQTYMMADIAALQRMYGADFSTNSGNTVYKWKPSNGDTLVNGKVGIDAASAAAANRIFATIWDGGGKDTYDLSAYKTDLRIDLRPGKHSLFSEKQLAYLGGGPNDGFSRGNIFNALLYKGDERSLIENAKGGIGSDTIAGNKAGNSLYGYSGKDKLLGYAGNDRLFGGKGDDRLDGGAGRDKLSGGKGADDFVFKKGYGRDTITDFQNNVDDIDLRSYKFSKVSQVLSKAAQVGSDVHIKLSASDIVVIEDFKLKHLDAADFIL